MDKAQRKMAPLGYSSSFRKTKIGNTERHSNTIYRYLLMLGCSDSRLCVRYAGTRWQISIMIEACMIRVDYHEVNDS